MIFIQKNQNNQCVLSLQEKSTIAMTGGSPYFLFRFTNDLDNGNTEKIFLPYYISSNTRYDYIQINENVTESLTGGTVSLSKEGFWTYEVYEQTSQYNLSLTGCTSCVEIGKVLVSGTTQYFI